MECSRRLYAWVVAVALLSTAMAGAQEPSAESYAAARAARRDTAQRLVARMTERIDSGKLEGKQLAETFRNRGVGYNYLLEYNKALEDFNHAIEIDLMDPQAYEDRAILYLKLRDYAKAGTDLDMALGLDSKRASAYREKGRVAAYRGDFDRAAIEFDRALQNSEGDAQVYTALWLHIALTRAGRGEQTPLKEVVAQMNPERWPYPAVQMFLGEIPPQAAVRAAASPVAGDELMRRCEAWFYAGEKYLIDGDTGYAREAFRSAVATEITDFLEYDWSVRELERLDGR